MTLPGLHLWTDVRGFHHGQTDVRIYAHVNNEYAGHLDYSEFGGAPHIQIIEVDPRFRGRGIGSSLVRKLAEDYPYGSIKWGWLTEEGSALRRRLDREQGLQPNPVPSPPQRWFDVGPWAYRTYQVGDPIQARRSISYREPRLTSRTKHLPPVGYPHGIQSGSQATVVLSERGQVIISQTDPYQERWARYHVHDPPEARQLWADWEPLVDHWGPLVRPLVRPAPAGRVPWQAARYRHRYRPNQRRTTRRRRTTLRGRAA